MNTANIERVIFLAEDSVFKTSEKLRRLIFSKQFASPQIEQIVQRMQNDLDVLLTSVRELSMEHANSESLSTT